MNSSVFARSAYLCDPHTAVAFAVLAAGGQSRGPAVVVSTASPFKFSGQVLASLGKDVPGSEFDALRALQDASGQSAPRSLAALAEKPERFKEIITPAEIAQMPLRFQ